MTPAERNAGLEKMARAMVSIWSGSNAWAEVDETTRKLWRKHATAALAAWEAHQSEIEKENQNAK